MAVKAVIFDLDDTLITEVDSAMRSLVAAVSAVCGGVQPTPDDVLRGIRTHWYGSPWHAECQRLGIASWEALWATFAGTHRCLDGLGDWAPEYRRLAWGTVLASVGASPSFIPDVTDAYIEMQRAGHPAIPSAVEARRSVDVACAILTNGPPDIQRHKLSKLPVDFDAVVISGEVGIGKPSSEVFDLVLSRLGVSAEDAVMIGDSWGRDVAGAVGVGMRAIWISQGAEPPAPPPAAVAVVERLTPAALELLA